MGHFGMLLGRVLALGRAWGILHTYSNPPPVTAVLARHAERKREMLECHWVFFYLSSFNTV